MECQEDLAQMLNQEHHNQLLGIKFQQLLQRHPYQQLLLLHQSFQRLDHDKQLFLQFHQLLRKH